MGGRALVAPATTIFSASARRFLSSTLHLRISSQVPLPSTRSFKNTTAKLPVGLFSNFSSVTPEQPEKSMANPIRISSAEQRIFDILKGVLAHFQLDIQLRVAGGWVRDKLLGKECHDIDIALENMVGKAFCEKVNKYLTTINQETRNIFVIQSNPDQSKHLETARMKIFGVEIDFVNLRSESYAENSRIPTMEFGSPMEDALRRDLTLNSK